MVNLEFKFISQNILNSEKVLQKMQAQQSAYDNSFRDVKNIIVDKFNISFEHSFDLNSKSQWEEIKNFFVRMNLDFNFKKSYIRIVSTSKWSPSSEVYQPLWICFSASDDEINRHFDNPDMFWAVLEHECILTTPQDNSVFAFDLTPITSLEHLKLKSVNLSLYLVHFTMAEKIKNTEVQVTNDELLMIKRMSLRLEYHDYDKDSDCILFFTDYSYDQQLSFRDYLFLHDLIKTKEFYRTDLKRPEDAHLIHVKFSSITVRFFYESGAKELNSILKSLNIGVEFFDERTDKYYPL